MIRDWAKDHKTMVLLNGGHSNDLVEFYMFLDVLKDELPFAVFCEEGVGGAMTSVGLILPDYIYKAIPAVIEGKAMYDEYYLAMTEPEKELAIRLAKMRLAI